MIREQQQQQPKGGYNQYQSSSSLFPSSTTSVFSKMRLDIESSINSYIGSDELAIGGSGCNPLQIPDARKEGRCIGSTRRHRRRRSHSQLPLNIIMAAAVLPISVSAFTLLPLQHHNHPNHYNNPQHQQQQQQFLHHFMSPLENNLSLLASRTELNMVSTTERLIEKRKSPIRASKIAATSNTSKRTRTSNASSTRTASRTATSSGTVRRIKQVTVNGSTSNTSKKTNGGTRRKNSINVGKTKSTKLNTSDDVSTSSLLAETAATLFNLPSYSEAHEEWNDSDIIPSSPTVHESSHNYNVTSDVVEKPITTVSVSKSKPVSKSTTKISSSPQKQALTSSSSSSTEVNKIKSTKKRTSESVTSNERTPVSTTSRQSTMPGFLNTKHTGRRVSFRDGVNIVKKANSKNAKVSSKIHRITKSQSQSKSRQKANSEAMYASSASVPDSLIAFTNEIHLEERITPKEELELGTLTQEAIRLQKLYDNLLNEYGREPSDDEYCAAAGKINMEALEDAIQQGLHAKNQLVTSNLRMVQGVVNLYIRNGLGCQYNAGDLMQEGTIALIRAAEKFEPERGFRFSTYAMYWIRAAVKRSQILQSRVITVPQRLHDTHKKVLRVESQLKKELGRKPQKAELALACGITETQLDRCLKAFSQQCFSLDAEIVNTLKPNSGDRNGETSYNLFSAKYDDVEYRELQNHFLKEDLVSTLKRYLSPHEVDLVLLRYGLMDERTLSYGFSGPLTIAEVSRLVGLKPDKVRRMINKSLRQLRHLIAHEWEDFESLLHKY